VCGTRCRPSRCNLRLLELIDLMSSQSTEVPMPSYKVTPVEAVLSQSFKHRVRLEETVCVDALRPVDWAKLGEVQGAYFGWQGSASQWEVEVKPGASAAEPQLLLQLGWPDGVGIWRGNSLNASLVQWQCEWQLRAFDHLPTRSLVEVHAAGRTLQVWLGFVKLHAKRPTVEALRQLLFGDASCSARSCDVVALFLTDVFIMQEDLGNFRGLLKRCMDEDFCFNEDDPALLTSQVPAELMRCTEDGMGYVSMHVAIRRKYLKSGGRAGHFHDGFRDTPFITCKSPSESSQSPKLVLRQDVVLQVEGQEVDLALLGLDLDAEDAARLAQVEAMERVLTSSQKGNKSFCALAWGNFSNSLVAFQGLDHRRGADGEHQFSLTEQGVESLVSRLRCPQLRRDLLKKDSLVYTGPDLTGRPYRAPEGTSKLRAMFRMSLEAALDWREVPWPSFRVQPFEVMLAAQLGCRLRVLELVFLGKSPGPWPGVEKTADAGCFFGWEKADGKRPQRAVKSEKPEGAEKGAMYLQLGWLDGVGVYRKNSVQASVLSWEAPLTVRAFDHLPLRALMSVRV